MSAGGYTPTNGLFAGKTIRSYKAPGMNLGESSSGAQHTSVLGYQAEDGSIKTLGGAVITPAPTKSAAAAVQGGTAPQPTETTVTQQPSLISGTSTGVSRKRRNASILGGA